MGDGNSWRQASLRSWLLLVVVAIGALTIGHVSALLLIPPSTPCAPSTPYRRHNKNGSETAPRPRLQPLRNDFNSKAGAWSRCHSNDGCTAELQQRGLLEQYGKRPRLGEDHAWAIRDVCIRLDCADQKSAKGSAMTWSATDKWQPCSGGFSDKSSFKGQCVAVDRARKPISLGQTDRLAVVYVPSGVAVDPLDLHALGMPAQFIGDDHLAVDGNRAISESLPWLQWVADTYDEIRRGPHEYFVFRHIGRGDWHRGVKDSSGENGRIFREARPSCVAFASPTVFREYGRGQPWNADACEHNAWVERGKLRRDANRDPRTAPQPIGECNTPTGCLEVEALDELARVIGLSPWQAPPPDEPCAAKALKTNTRMASNWNAHVARAPASSEGVVSRAALLSVRRETYRALCELIVSRRDLDWGYAMERLWNALWTQSCDASGDRLGRRTVATQEIPFGVLVRLSGNATGDKLGRF